MTQLFTVSFTTRKSIKKLDGKGKIISETKLDTPVTMHALPYQTAKSYAGCDNFKMVPYVMDEHRPRTAKGSGRDNSVGNGTKKISHRRDETAGRTGKDLGAIAKSSVNEAARSGNLAAALNA
jgi:hypothetical protein